MRGEHKGSSGERMGGFARNYYPNQVHGISSGNRQGIGIVAVPSVPQTRQNVRQSKLLAAKPIDKASAAHFSTIFEPAKHSQKQTPARDIGLQSQEIAKYHSISRQQHAGRRLNRFILIARL